jgi:hypothetical protein
MGFAEVFILKTVQVICFETLLQVLILNNLRALVCTKIVQNIVQKGVRFESVANKRVRAYEQSPESKNADQGDWRSRAWADYYPSNTARWWPHFVKRKSMVKPRRQRGCPFLLNY